MPPFIDSFDTSEPPPSSEVHENQDAEERLDEEEESLPSDASEGDSGSPVVHSPRDLVELYPNARPSPILDPTNPHGSVPLSWLDSTFVEHGVYVSNELLVMTGALRDIWPILSRHQLEIIESVELMDEYWLHRVLIPTRVTTDDEVMARLSDIDQLNDEETCEVSDLDVIWALVIALEEQALGNMVTLNPMIQNQTDDDGELESPMVPEGYSPDPHTWTYLSNGVSGFNVHRAWSLFKHARRNAARQTIAVIDTGFGPSNDLIDLHDLVSWTGESNQLATARHGTNIAATIAGSRGDNYGTVGIGYQSAQLLMIDYQTPTLFHGLSALRTAIEGEVKVINMSWITAPPLPVASIPEGNAFDSFFSELGESALIIAAAGNQSRNLDTSQANIFPCSAASVLCVGGVDADKRIHEDSNFGVSEHGSAVDIYGPYTILGYENTEEPLDGLAEVSGTSMSSAVVSGLVSMLLAADPSLSSFQLKDALVSTADRHGVHRHLNAYAALHLVVGNTAPQIEIISPSEGNETYPMIQTLTLNAVSFDIEDNSGTDIRWESNLEGDLGWGSTVRINLRMAGEHRITATATDSEGFSNSAVVTVNMRYQPPTLSVDSLGPDFLDNIVDAGTRIVLTARATDPNQWDEPDICDRIQWTDTTNGIDRELGRGCEVIIPGFRPGQNSVRCSVSNNTGQTTTQDFTVHALNGNFLEAPLVHVISPAESQNGQSIRVRWNQSIDLRAIAHAPNDPRNRQVLSYRWTYRPMIRGLLRGERLITENNNERFVPSQHLAGPCREQLMSLDFSASNVVDETTRDTRLIRIICE